jgi:hypothetical protein
MKICAEIFITMQLLLNFTILLTLLSAGCSSDPNQESVPENSGFNDPNLIAFVDSAKILDPEEDLSSFFSDSQEVVAQNASDGARLEQNPLNEKLFQADEPLVVSQDYNQVQTPESAASVPYADSKEQLVNKDETIESISRLNQELLAEITRLKKSKKRDVATPVPTNSDNAEELENIRAKLIKKTEEINFLKVKNSNLEERISKLENLPSQISLQEPVQNPPHQSSVKNFHDNKPITKVKPVALCSLDFDAVVTLQSGKNREALYTEFFLLDQSLFDLLNQEIDISKYSGISSFEELWAQSRKSPYRFPGIYKQIRNRFLSQTSSGHGYRARTDLNGSGNFRNVRPGLYFLVGTASLGTVGVTWNVPVYLRDGTNKTSLTLSNASWRE